MLTGFPDTNKKAKKALEARSAVAIDWPLQTMQIIEGSIRLLGKSDWVIFTSPSAVRLYMQHLYPLNPFSKAACVGTSTAAALEDDYGRACSLMPSEVFSAKSLADEVINYKELFIGKKILFPCSRLAKNDLLDSLEAEGLVVRRHEFYVPEQTEGGALPDFDSICFFSSSAVEAYFTLEAPTDLRNKKIALIGESTAVTFKQYSDVKYALAKEANAEGTVKALFA